MVNDSDGVDSTAERSDTPLDDNEAQAKAALAAAEAADAQAEADMPAPSAVRIPLRFHVTVPANPVVKRELSAFEAHAESADTRIGRLPYKSLVQKLTQHVTSREDPEVDLEAFRAQVYVGDVVKEWLVNDEYSWNHANRLIMIRNNKRGSKFLQDISVMLESEIASDDLAAKDTAFKKLVELASLPEMHQKEKLSDGLLLKVISEVHSINRSPSQDFSSAAVGSSRGISKGDDEEGSGGAGANSAAKLATTISRVIVTCCGFPATRIRLVRHGLIGALLGGSEARSQAGLLIAGRVVPSLVGSAEALDRIAADSTNASGECLMLLAYNGNVAAINMLQFTIEANNIVSSSSIGFDSGNSGTALPGRIPRTLANFLASKVQSDIIQSDMLQQNIGKNYASILISLATSGSPKIGEGALFILLKLLDEAEIASHEKTSFMDSGLTAPIFVSAKLKNDEQLYQQTMRALYKLVVRAEELAFSRGDDFIAALRTMVHGLSVMQHFVEPSNVAKKWFDHRSLQLLVNMANVGAVLLADHKKAMAINGMGTSVLVRVNAECKEIARRGLCVLHSISDVATNHKHSAFHLRNGVPVPFHSVPELPQLIAKYIDASIPTVPGPGHSKGFQRAGEQQKAVEDVDEQMCCWALATMSNILDGPHESESLRLKWCGGDGGEASKQALIEAAATRKKKLDAVAEKLAKEEAAAATTAEEGQVDEKEGQEKSNFIDIVDQDMKDIISFWASPNLSLEQSSVPLDPFDVQERLLARALLLQRDISANVKEWKANVKQRAQQTGTLSAIRPPQVFKKLHVQQHRLRLEKRYSLVSCCLMHLLGEPTSSNTYPGGSTRPERREQYVRVVRRGFIVPAADAIPYVTTIGWKVSFNTEVATKLVQEGVCKRAMHWIDTMASALQKHEKQVLLDRRRHAGVKDMNRVDNCMSAYEVSDEFKGMEPKVNLNTADAYDSDGQFEDDEDRQERASVEASEAKRLEAASSQTNLGSPNPAEEAQNTEVRNSAAGKVAHALAAKLHGSHDENTKHTEPTASTSIAKMTRKHIEAIRVNKIRTLAIISSAELPRFGDQGHPIPEDEVAMNARYLNNRKNDDKIEGMLDTTWVRGALERLVGLMWIFCQHTDPEKVSLFGLDHRKKVTDPEKLEMQRLNGPRQRFIWLLVYLMQWRAPEHDLLRRGSIATIWVAYAKRPNELVFPAVTEFLEIVTLEVAESRNLSNELRLSAFKFNQFLYYLKQSKSSGGATADEIDYEDGGTDEAGSDIGEGTVGADGSHSSRTEISAALALLRTEGDDSAQAFGAGVIAKAAIEPRQRLAASDAGGVEVLVGVLRKTRSEHTRLMALHALLHLSALPKNQVKIVKLGLRLCSQFARIHPTNQMESFICVYAGMILVNCERNPKNRTAMYKEELRCKTVDIQSHLGITPRLSSPQRAEDDAVGPRVDPVTGERIPKRGGLLVADSEESGIDSLTKYASDRPRSDSPATSLLATVPLNEAKQEGSPRSPTSFVPGASDSANPEEAIPHETFKTAFSDWMSSWMPKKTVDPMLSRLMSTNKSSNTQSSLTATEGPLTPYKPSDGLKRSDPSPRSKDIATLLKQSLSRPMAVAWNSANESIDHADSVQDSGYGVGGQKRSISKTDGRHGSMGSTMTKDGHRATTKSTSDYPTKKIEIGNRDRGGQWKAHLSVQERTASLLYELKNVEQFEPWSPRFEYEDPAHTEENAARRKRQVERAKRTKAEKATKAATKAEAKKQKQLEALGVKKMAASPMQRNATAVSQRASTGGSPAKGAVAKEEVTVSHKSSGLREKSRPASDDNKSSEASFIVRAKAKRAARNRRLRPPYTVKLADSSQVVHFNKGMNEDDDLDSRMWTVDQPDQPKVVSWRHVDGCQSCLGLYEHVTLPDGTKVHHHCKRWPYHLDPDVMDLPPKPPEAPLTLEVFTTSSALPSTPEDAQLHGGLNLFARQALLPTINSNARTAQMTSPTDDEKVGGILAPSSNSVLKLELDIEPVELSVIEVGGFGSKSAPKGRWGPNGEYLGEDLLNKSETVDIHAPRWTIHKTRVWALRKKENESRDFYSSTDKMVKLQLKADMEHISVKSKWEETNGKVLQLTLNQPEDENKQLTKVLIKYYTSFTTLFTGYSSKTSSYFEMPQSLLAEFLSDTKICDENVATSDIEAIFIRVNLKDKSDDKKMLKVNNEGAMMRFQFIEFICYIALEKFVMTKKCPSWGAGVEKLAKEHILPLLAAKSGTVVISDEDELGGQVDSGSKTRLNVHRNSDAENEKEAPPLQPMVGDFAFVDSDYFRRERLYTKAVDDILANYGRALSAVYKVATATTMEKKGMNISEWGSLLDLVGLVVDDDFTRRDANLCFIVSRCRRADEVEDKLTERTITYFEFLEAFCRVAERKTMPCPADCARCNANDPADLYHAYVAGTLEKRKGPIGVGMEESSGTGGQGGGGSARSGVGTSAVGVDFQNRGPKGFAVAIEQTEEDRVRSLSNKVLSLLIIAMGKLQKTQLVCAFPQVEKVVRGCAERSLSEWSGVMAAYQRELNANN